MLSWLSGRCRLHVSLLQDHETVQDLVEGTGY